MSTIFEVASRKAIRFDSSKGKLSVEDLWNLPLTHDTRANLDNMAQGIRKDLRESEEKSFVKMNTKDKVLALKFEIIKHIIAIRVEEQIQAAQAKTNKAKKTKLLAVLASKQDDNLHQMSEAQITAMINEL